MQPTDHHPNRFQSIWQRFRGMRHRTQAGIWAGLGTLLLCSCCGGLAAIGNAGSSATSSHSTTANSHGSSTTTHQPTAVPTQPPATATAQPTVKPLPTATPTVPYPPKTKDDLDALAALGDASAIHEFNSESTGLVGVCPEPRVEVTVSPSVTGKRLAEDLLAFFYSQQLDNPCGSLVLAYHNQSEANDSYTAGRINLDVADSSGQPNTDPSGTNLTYTVTLDVGDVVSGQEYMVTYQQ